MNKGKTILITAGIEIMLIICIMTASLNPTPVRYFIFYNLLYGLVFSFLVPLYCLYKENGTPASAGMKKPGRRQWIVLFVFVVCSTGGQLIPKMAAGEQIPWHLLPVGIVPLIMTTFFEDFYSGDLCRAESNSSTDGRLRFYYPAQCFPFIIQATPGSAVWRICFCYLR